MAVANSQGPSEPESYPELLFPESILVYSLSKLQEENSTGRRPHGHRASRQEEAWPVFAPCHLVIGREAEFLREVRSMLHYPVPAADDIHTQELRFK